MRNLHPVSFFCAVSILLFASATQALTYTAVQDGNWHNSATWDTIYSPDYIDQDDQVVIPAGITVTNPELFNVFIEINESISNDGSGVFTNFGTFINLGDVNIDLSVYNPIEIVNSNGGLIHNVGQLLNSGKIVVDSSNTTISNDNGSLIYNAGTFDNPGLISYCDSENNQDVGTINGLTGNQPIYGCLPSARINQPENSVVQRPISLIGRLQPHHRELGYFRGSVVSHPLTFSWALGFEDNGSLIPIDSGSGVEFTTSLPNPGYYIIDLSVTDASGIQFTERRWIVGLAPQDNDADGYTTGVDCDDANATVYPGAPEIAGDQVVQNCNGTADFEETCAALGGVFASATCTTGGVYYGRQELGELWTYIIPPGMTLSFPGDVSNRGIIVNHGTLNVGRESFNNYGLIHNAGDLVKDGANEAVITESGFFNFGRLENQGRISVSGGGYSPLEYSAVINMGIMENYGTINSDGGYLTKPPGAPWTTASGMVNVNILNNSGTMTGSILNANQGTLSNEGFIRHGGVVENYGIFYNPGHVDSDTLTGGFGSAANYGIFHNSGTISQRNDFYNDATLEQTGIIEGRVSNFDTTFDNNGIIYGDAENFGGTFNNHGDIQGSAHNYGGVFNNYRSIVGPLSNYDFKVTYIPNTSDIERSPAVSIVNNHGLIDSVEREILHKVSANSGTIYNFGVLDGGLRNNEPDDLYALATGTLINCGDLFANILVEGTILDCNIDTDGDSYTYDVDCNDGNSAIFPGAPEIPGDNIDQDCDGQDLAPTDNDNDGYFTDYGDLDCDDADPAISPGAVELLDGIDNNCSGVIDEGFSDPDGDLVDSGVDNCPDNANPDQQDTDGDGSGDICDATPNGDDDNDGIDNLDDNCPTDANTDQIDTDSDGSGDACDTTPNGDDDLDTVDNLLDNCPLIANPDQQDTDGDGQGDACDQTSNGTPEEKIDVIIDKVTTDLIGAESIVAPLQSAIALLEDDNPKNDKAVCGKLHSVKNQINAREGKKRNGISNTQADELRSELEQIETDLGCVDSA